jgi:hypothetical protein
VTSKGEAVKQLEKGSAGNLGTERDVSLLNYFRMGFCPSGKAVVKEKM